MEVSPGATRPLNYVKSKQRVADHGEVFTPPWMVEAMLDLVKGETERIDSRFLEPACGSGNFLVQILRRKLAAVELKYGQSDLERDGQWSYCLQWPNHAKHTLFDRHSSRKRYGFGFGWKWEQCIPRER